MKRQYVPLTMAVGGLVVLMALVLFIGRFTAQAGPLTQKDSTPVPTIPPVPTIGGNSSDETLAVLAREAEAANRDEGAATLWRNGMLGYDDGSRLGIQIGDKFPAFGLTTQQGDVLLLDMLGTPVFVNFWASWCGPCIGEFPVLIARHQDPAAPYQVVFVNVWDDEFTYRQFLADYPSDILAVFDVTEHLPDVYGLDFIPVSVLVDERGMVQMIQFGPVNDPVMDFASALVTLP